MSRNDVRSLRLGALVAGAFFVACGEGVHLIREQRLPSGRAVKVVSCLLAWGIEHDERHADRDGFALEYLSEVPHGRLHELEREALEVFELIRPISEQWGLSSATVTALRTPERTGTYHVFAFTRSAEGMWSHTSQAITRDRD